MWKQTLNLPKSLLGKRSNAARNAELFSKVTSTLYTKQLEAGSGPLKTLHDGPPYANGELHMGHALNKILKDFVNRTRVLMGNTVKYTPGWDCHGLPIELKALAGVKSELTSIEKRRRARELARKMVGVQSQQFQSYCLMADFSDVYLTMNPEYVYNELQLFRQLVAKNLVSRQEKPVFWSPESKTALAESELVYATKESTACYVGYDVTNDSVSALTKKLGLPKAEGPVQLVIWTTTPWTLVANQAIAVNERVDYIFLRSSSKLIYIVSENALKTLSEITPNHVLTEIGKCKGSDLIGLQYTCPLRKSVHNVVHGDHVTADGTGLVHTAPAHGKEDYLVGLKNKLKVKSVVDEHGKYVDDFGLELKGLDARKVGARIVLNALDNSHLLNTHTVSHSVPLDWRSNKPVLIRSTKQFFIDLQPLRQRASEALKSVTFVPAVGIDRLEAFLNTRSEWCISRQRCWGVPIPVFVNKDTGEPVLEDEIIEFVIAKMKNAGLEAWFVPDSEFRISEWLPQHRQDLATKVVRCQDTLDVWLDSGSSFLSGYKNPATTYLEGSDQHRGWFQSSLLLNAALHESAPFEQLVTHGFVLDKHKQKMSKSVGNVISPDSLIKRIGVDGLRLFVAQSNYTSDISMNEQSIESAAALVKKLRLTFNFMLGNTVDFRPTNLASNYELSLLDKFMLNSLQELKSTVESNYEQLNFQNAVRHIQVHLNSLMSAVYFDSVKDTLYADEPSSAKRRAVQFVLVHALMTYVRILSPLIPLLTQEVWEACPAFVTNNVETPLLAKDVDMPVIPQQEIAGFPRLIELRDLVNECVELAKQDKAVTSALTCDIYIDIDAGFPKELIETVCVASNVKFGTTESAYTLTKNGTTVSVTKPSMNKCERCWKHNAEDNLCTRCHSVVHDTN